MYKGRLECRGPTPCQWSPRRWGRRFTRAGVGNNEWKSSHLFDQLIPGTRVIIPTPNTRCPPIET
ncbi:hypothetical protein J6590_051374 [Homalodisca vitripennis]|nr:hypothetical protein J6590_051374 [Homalodisca vitripennis]